MEQDHDPVVADGQERATEAAPEERRAILDTGTVVMAAGLAASYGTFAYMAGRFLYPNASKTKAWMFVCRTAEIAEQKSLKFQTPSGAKVNVARVSAGDSVDSFIALSSTCPHLGCQVHWEAQKNRFFCPCHNGTFAPDGKATGGPPADANQSLPRYQLRVDKGLLYMWVETEKLAAAGVIEDDGHRGGGGHDPCLAPRDTRLC